MKAALEKAGRPEAGPAKAYPLRDLRDAPAHQLAVLARLSNRNAQAEFSTKFGVNLGEWTVLAHIHIHAPVTLAELSQATMLDKGQLSRTVQRLVQRGWVNSRPSSTHRAAVQLSLTAVGEERHDALLAYAAIRNEWIMSALTPDEQHCFITCIRKLRAHFAPDETGAAEPRTAVSPSREADDSHDRR